MLGEGVSSSMANTRERSHEPTGARKAVKRGGNLEKRPLNEAKLLVVGREAVGKTSLVNFLVHNRPRDPDEERTEGAAQHEKIETTQWTTDNSDPTPFEVF